MTLEGLHDDFRDLFVVFCRWRSRFCDRRRPRTCMSRRPSRECDAPRLSRFGDTLFGGSPFIRWTLSPFLLVFALAAPLLIDRWTPIRVVVVSGMEFACIALLTGLWLPARVGRWALR